MDWHGEEVSTLFEVSMTAGPPERVQLVLRRNVSTMLVYIIRN